MIEGEELKIRRENMEKSIEQIAKIIGVNPDFLSGLEKNQISFAYIKQNSKSLTSDIINKLCREYSINPTLFFKGEDQKDKYIKKCQDASKTQKTNGRNNSRESTALINRTRKNTIKGKLIKGLAIFLATISFGKISFEIGKNNNPIQKEINKQMDKIKDDNELRTDMVKKILAERLSSAYNMVIKPENISLKIYNGKEDGFNVIACPQNKDMRAAVKMGSGVGESGLNYCDENDYYIVIKVTDDLKNVLMKTSLTESEGEVYKTIPYGETYDGLIKDDTLFPLVKKDVDVLHSLLDDELDKKLVNQFIKNYLARNGIDAGTDAVRNATSDNDEKRVISEIRQELGQEFPNVYFDFEEQEPKQEQEQEK